MLPARFLDIAASAALRVFGGDAVAAAEFLAGDPIRKRGRDTDDTFRSFLKKRYGLKSRAEDVDLREMKAYLQSLRDDGGFVNGRDDMTEGRAKDVIAYEIAATGFFDNMLDSMWRESLMDAFRAYLEGAWSDNFEKFVSYLLSEYSATSSSQGEERDVDDIVREAKKLASDANWAARFSDSGFDLRVLAAIGVVFYQPRHAIGIKRKADEYRERINELMLGLGAQEGPQDAAEESQTKRARADPNFDPLGLAETPVHSSPAVAPSPPLARRTKKNRRQQEAQGSSSSSEYDDDDDDEEEEEEEDPRGGWTWRDLKIAATELGGNFALPQGPLPMRVDRAEFEQARRMITDFNHYPSYKTGALSADLKAFLREIVLARAIEVFKKDASNKPTFAVLRSRLQLPDWAPPFPEWADEGFKEYHALLEEGERPPSSVHELSSYNSDDELVDQKQEHPRWRVIREEWLEFLDGLEDRTLQVAKLRKVFQRQDDLVLFKHDSDTFRPSDLKSLRGTAWLSDKVVNTYLQRHSERAPLEKCIVLGSVWFDRMVAGQKVRAAEDGVRQKLNTFRPDTGLLMVPVFIDADKHWALLWADFFSKKIYYADSLSSSSAKKTTVDAFKGFLERVSGIAAAAWSFKQLTPGRDIPQQRNSHDCGVFVIRLGKAILDECGLGTSARVDYDQARVAIALDLATMGDDEKRIEYQVCPPPARRETLPSSQSSDSDGIDALLNANINVPLGRRGSPASKPSSKEVEMVDSKSYNVVKGDLVGENDEEEQGGEVPKVHTSSGAADKFNPINRPQYLPYVLMLKREDSSKNRAISQPAHEQLRAVVEVLGLDTRPPNHDTFNSKWKKEDLSGVAELPGARDMRAVFSRLRPDGDYSEEIARAVAEMIRVDKRLAVYRQIVEVAGDAQGSAPNFDNYTGSLDPIARGIVEAYGDRHRGTLKDEFTAVRRVLKEIRAVKAPKVPRSGENPKATKPREPAKPAGGTEVIDMSSSPTALKYLKMLGYSSVPQTGRINFAASGVAGLTNPQIGEILRITKGALDKKRGVARAQTPDDWRKLKLPSIAERIRVFNQYLYPEIGKKRGAFFRFAIWKAIQNANINDAADVFERATGKKPPLDELNLSDPKIGEVPFSQKGELAVAFAANIVDGVLDEMEQERAATEAEVIDLRSALVLSRGNEALAARLLARLG